MYLQTKKQKNVVPCACAYAKTCYTYACAFAYTCSCAYACACLVSKNRA